MPFQKSQDMLQYIEEPRCPAALHRRQLLTAR
jgi:hypothetical protein